MFKILAVIFLLFSLGAWAPVYFKGGYDQDFQKANAELRKLESSLRTAESSVNRAVREIEESHDSEIQRLQRELQQCRSSQGSR